ncbi:MAG: hypothetical protein NTX56_05290 [Proteobacteria bacterium]|nr:hypothetical protein [Pseudomonadota bacterium]
MKHGLKAEKVTADMQPVLEGQVIPLRPIPARRLPLDSIEHCRREAARIYRLARSGAMEKADATKMVFMLSEITKLLLAGKMEQRLTALEGVQRGDGGAGYGEES